MASPIHWRCHSTHLMSISIPTPEAKAGAVPSPLNWYYSVEGRSHGPIKEQDLLRLAQDGAVVTDTLIWHPGREEWEPLWKLMPQAIAHLKKPATSEAPKGDTERIPLGEQGQVATADETMFRRLFARLKKS